jgi:4-amino-4-deoxy-L-arabinose transferase-like glycosyltransferase
MTPVGLWLVAAATRCAYVASVAATQSVRYPMVDSRAYHERALEILAGDWLGDRIFYQDPLYPYFLAGLYSVLEPGSPAVLFAQALLDAVTVVFVYGIARRVFDESSAVVAGLLACFYVMFAYYDALLLKIPLTLLLVTSALYLVVRAVQDGRNRSWLGAGVALGLATLTRGNYLLAAPALALWMLLAGEGDRRRRATQVLLFGAGLALAIAPVTLRNAAVGGDFVLVTSQAGQNFYIGNQRGNAVGSYKVLDFVRSHPRFEEADFRVEAERRTGRILSPSEVSRFWFREGLREIVSDPEHFGYHTSLKAAMFFNHYEVPDNQSFYFFRAYVAPWLSWPLPSYGLVLPLGLCGMWLARRNGAARPLLIFFVTYASSVIAFYNMSRYRMPVVPVLLVFAGFTLVWGFEAVVERRWRAAAVLAAVLLTGWGLAHVRITEPNLAIFHYNLAVSHLHQAHAAQRRAISSTRAGDAEGAQRALEELEQHRALAETELRRGTESRPHNRPLRALLHNLSAGRLAERLSAGHRERELRRLGAGSEADAAAPLRRRSAGARVDDPDLSRTLQGLRVPEPR